MAWTTEKRSWIPQKDLFPVLHGLSEQGLFIKENDWFKWNEQAVMAMDYSKEDVNRASR
ncbi:hypothetical protein TrispH2_009266 [Trichoplax sp. H2]|nr:hypothetical protein TrispH2_009266 [Trichoplax sp. H2]|eukprot:RDD37762.1 hypothetical protein TrispH2_009266 [Trichoplax sp. H2]